MNRQPFERIPWLGVLSTFGILQRRKRNAVQLEADFVRRHLVFGQVHLRLLNQFVHRSRHRAVQRLGETERAAGWGDELSVGELLSVVFHELSDRGQRPFDEPVVVGDPLAKHHDEYSDAVLDTHAAVDR